MTQKAVVLSGDYNYDDQITTTIKSIAYHIDNVKIYLINYDIPQEYFENINRYLYRIGSTLIDLKINPEIFNDEEDPSFGYISKITYGRLLIPRLVPEDQVLYIDSDAIVDQNIDELWPLGFEGHPLAAVHDVFADIFNAGILLINNKKLKEEDNIVDRMLEAGKEKGLRDADQAVLNKFFNHNYLGLDIKYNYVIGYDRDVTLAPSNAPTYFELMDSCKDPKIIHYASADKPWNMTSSGRMREKWWQYKDLDWTTIINRGELPNLNKISRGQLFTLTDSDSMVHLAELAAALPDFEFHVAAFTEVSPTLLNYMRYHNVRVYPSISRPRLNELLHNCTAWLDINQGNKFNDIINDFAKNGRAVYSFANEQAQLDESVNQQTFADTDYRAMIIQIKEDSKE